MRSALVVPLLALAVLAPAAQAATGETQIVVGRDPGLSSTERAQIRRDADVKLDRTLRVSNTEVVTTDDPQAALAALRSDPDVRYAQVVQYRHAFSSDADFSWQWGLDNTGENFVPDFNFPTTADADMDVPEAWALGVSGAGVSVGVVDTGTSPNHPDLSGQIDTSRSRGFVTGDPSNDFVDGNEHGTHVSGIIAAKQDTTGISGIAYGSKIVAMRVLNDAGNGSDVDIANAMDYAGDIGLKIVNASLGGSAPAPLIADAITSHPNTLFVIAAGNGGNDGVGDDNDNQFTPTYPCDVPAANVVCVGASDEDDLRTSFSNFGQTNVDLFAPGQDIYSTVLNDGWGFLDGTSMATPAVAAEAALLLDAKPGLSTAQLKSILLSTVDEKAAFQGISVSGGRANADAAVAKALNTAPAGGGGGGGGGGTPPPPVHQTPPPAGAPAPPAPVNTGDKDSDGRTDVLDACPTEAAHTPNGCPKPTVRSAKVKLRKHRARISIRTDRPATVAVKVERRVCNSHGKKCKWRTVYNAAKLSRRNAASFTSHRLRRGKYRVSVRLLSDAGNAKLVRKSFRA